MNASAKQVAYVAALDAKVGQADWPSLTADDALFGPGTYGRHLQRKWADGGLCARGASDLIGLYKRALAELEAEVRWYESLPPQPESRSYRDSWA